MHITRATAIAGEPAVPGDKSIAHRALLLGALADGVTRVANVPASDDLAATRRCLEALGVPIVRNGGGALYVTGGRMSEAATPLDCGGSGTTIRLIAGLLAGMPFRSILAANDQLARRPMQRIVEPLARMGADIGTIAPNGHAPQGRGAGGRQPVLVIRGGGLHGIEYRTPVASAQIKSCVLLAGVNAAGETIVIESAATRDHTERMLHAMGARIAHDTQNNSVRLSPSRLAAADIHVPGDFSSAAFFVAAGLLVPNADLLLRGVNLNPTRTGLLNIVAAMGASVAVESARDETGEPVGDLRVRSADGLRGATIGGGVVPRAIDEFPLVALLATQAHGETLVRDAAELRVKESDRVTAVIAELRKLGAELDERPDGFVVRGPTPLTGARVDSHGDHRLAMMLAVAGLIASGETRVEGAECVSKSFPEFERTLRGIVR